MTPLDTIARLLAKYGHTAQTLAVRSLAAREEMRVELESFWADVSGPELFGATNSIASLVLGGESAPLTPALERDRADFRRALWLRRRRPVAARCRVAGVRGVAEGAAAGLAQRRRGLARDFAGLLLRARLRALLQAQRTEQLRPVRERVLVAFHELDRELRVARVAQRLRSARAARRWCR